MNMLKSVLPALCVAWILAGCAVSDGLPKLQTWPKWQSGETRWFKLESLDAGGNVLQTSLLAVQPEQDTLRFVQTDPLGAPVSRQVLSRKGWANDGFVAPNAEARRLFGALLPLLAAPGQAVYPQQQSRQEQGETVYFQQNHELWRSRLSADGQTFIRFPNQKQWRISPVEE